jgi:glycosyltransferase involved in cell wall biosynthesis
MKILVLSNLYPPHYVGGYELCCQMTVEALRARGHVIEVLTSDFAADGVTWGNDAGVTRTLRIHGMFGRPWLGILGLRRLEEFNNRTVRAALDRIKPDLVFVWNCSGLSKSILFTLQNSGVPAAFFVSDHWIARAAQADVWLRWWNGPAQSVAQKFLRAVWTLTGQRRKIQRSTPTNAIAQLQFRRVIFCSRALRELTATAGFAVRHGAIIHCPVNIQRFNGQPRLASRPLQRLLYVGRLADDKGVMTLVRAMALLRDKFAGSLTICGRGEMAATLQQFVASSRLPVTFDFTATPDRMPQVYASHDALLFTSEWAEPFALVPLEAMSCGLPVIGTTVGGSAELFRDGENALTYRAGSAEELAQRILELDKDSLLREKIAAGGHREVRARLAEPVIIDQIEAYLGETLRGWQPLPVLDYTA